MSFTYLFYGSYTLLKREERKEEMVDGELYIFLRKTCIISCIFFSSTSPIPYDILHFIHKVLPSFQQGICTFATHFGTLSTWQTLSLAEAN